LRALHLISLTNISVVEDFSRKLHWHTPIQTNRIKPASAPEKRNLLNAEDLNVGVLFSELKMVVSFRLNLSCAMIHLLEQKVWQIKDERGKFEKKLGW
jgi:hypothetical protein